MRSSEGLISKERLTWTGLGLLVLLVCLGGTACTDGKGVEASESSTQPRSSTADRDDQDDQENPATDAAGDDENAEEAVPVEVAVLSHGAIESVLRFSSNLEAEQQVQVFSQAKRLVRELLVEEGDDVRKGHVLLRLEDQEQRSAVQKARSQLDKAEREYRKRKRLYDEELISRDEFTDAIYEVEQLQISLADAERELGYTQVTAPISGTVTARKVNLGDQVQISQHLFDIVDFDSLVARIFVPEKHLPGLRPGLDARVSGAAASGDHRGEVERISPVVDPQTGTVKVTVAIGRQPGLRPGLYVDVDLITATHEEAVLVPKRALVYDSDQVFVYRLGDDRRVKRIFIEPMIADKEFIEPRDGLEAGDHIVIAGQAGLKDNALVKLPGADQASQDPTDPAAPAEAQVEPVERASR